MRAFQHESLGTHSAGGIALDTGRNGLVLRCDDVPVWFGAPRCLGDLVAEALHGQRALGRVHDIGLVRRPVPFRSPPAARAGPQAVTKAYHPSTEAGGP